MLCILISSVGYSQLISLFLFHSRKPVLKGISFTVLPGTTTALVSNNIFLYIYFVQSQLIRHSKYSAMLSKIHFYKLLYGDFAHWDMSKVLD